MFYFVGWTLTTLWLPPLSDIYGRKIFFLTAMASGMVFHLGIYFAQNWAVIIAMSFCIGLVSSLRIQVGFNYMIEFFPLRS